MLILDTSSSRNIYVGGIVGNNEGTTNNCKNNGNINIDIITNRLGTNIKSADIIIGGIAGENKSYVVNSKNFGDINYSNSPVDTSILETRERIGGIVGYGPSSTFCNVENCINVGNIEANTSEKNYSGGIIGYIYNSNLDVIPVQNVYNSGNITVTTHNTGKNLYIAGIAGNGEGNLQYCFNTGKVTHITNGESTVTKYRGAIVGDAHSSTKYLDCKYLSGSVDFGAEGSDADKLGNPIESIPNLTEQQILNEMNGIISTHNSSSQDEWLKW